MPRQDEKQRLRRRLQDYAQQLATNNSWAEAVDANQQILAIEEDPATYNRMGKALLELGRLDEALEAYQHTLRLSSINTIARRNIARLESLINRADYEAAFYRQTRQQVDLRLLITEAGKTIITPLIDVPRSPAVDALATGEKVELLVEGHNTMVTDVDGNIIGRIEPKIGQRLSELLLGGNRYAAAVVQSDPRQVRVLIREIYQDPSQRARTSFPGSLTDDSMHEYLSMRYDYETEDLMDEEAVDEPEISEEDFNNGEEEEELGLESIEKDIPDDDENEE